MLKVALPNLLDPRESEQYKYHILLDHLKVDQARRLALAYVNAPDPYTQAIQALNEQTLSYNGTLAIHIGDCRSLDQFVLKVCKL